MANVNTLEQQDFKNGQKIGEFKVKEIKTEAEMKAKHEEEIRKRIEMTREINKARKEAER